MSDKKPINRIPFESLTQVDKWSLPRMGEGGQVISAAQEEALRSRERIEDVIEPVQHKPMTAEQLNEIAEQAEQEGYKAGFDKGVAEGLEQGRQQGESLGQQQAYQENQAALTQQVQQLQAVCSSLMEPLNQQDAAVEKAVVEMAVGLAKHLLLQELATGSAGLERVVHQALGALPMGAANIRIFMHPDDLALVEHNLPGRGDNWKFIGDNRLHRGGCRIESDDSVVDFSVERRLKDYLQAVSDDTGTDDNAEELTDASVVTDTSLATDISSAEPGWAAPASSAPADPSIGDSHDSTN